MIKFECPICGKKYDVKFRAAYCCGAGYVIVRFIEDKKE